MLSGLSSLLNLNPTLLNPSTRSLMRLFRDVGLDFHSFGKISDANELVTIAIRTTVIAALLTGARASFKYYMKWINQVLFPTAYISHGDPAFHWIDAFLAQDADVQRQIYDFELSTTEASGLRKKSRNLVRRSHGGAYVEDANVAPNGTWSSDEVVAQVHPLSDQTIRIKHGGCYIWITKQQGTHKRGPLSYLRIRTLVFQREALKEFVIAAHKIFYGNKEDGELFVFHPCVSAYSRDGSSWSPPLSRPTRSWSSVILPEGLKDSVLQDVSDFLSDDEVKWYAARGIPHRRGYLFYGDPGAGKTTLVTALASKLQLGIHIISVASDTMDDSRLGNLFRACKSRSIILIEDIDRIFPKDEGQDHSSHPVPPAPVVGGRKRSQVTMSGLLNAIDGVSSQEGCVLIASTNHPDWLDPALSRAGRFDVRVPFQSADPDQAYSLFRHFYPSTGSSSLDTATLDEKGVLRDDIKSTSDGLDQLAQDFAQAIFPTNNRTEVRGKPGVTVSMATIQCYLLDYKKDPVQAVEDAVGWAASLRSNEVRATPIRAAAKKMKSKRAPKVYSAVIAPAPSNIETIPQSIFGSFSNIPLP